jgi:hypothetical protein
MLPSKTMHRHGTSYMNSTTLVATRDTMSLASVVLGFDIFELWLKESPDEDLHCIYVHATDSIKEQYPDLITGHFPSHEKSLHKLSPKVSMSQTKEAAF